MRTDVVVSPYRPQTLSGDHRRPISENKMLPALGPCLPLPASAQSLMVI